MILVTGAGGFVGRAVCGLLNEPYRALLHRPDPLFARANPHAQVVVGDLLDPDSLAPALSGVQAVIHLASLNVDHQDQGYERVNVQGTRGLLERAQAAGVQRLLSLSSTGVYGHRRHSLADEDTPVAPDSALSRSKAGADAALLQAHAAGLLQVTVLRHRFIYGPGDRFVLNGLHRSVTRSPFLIGGGRAALSLVHVQDLAQVALQLVREPEPRPRDPVYHVTDGAPVAFVELAKRLCEGLGGRVPERSVPFGLLHGALRLKETLLRADPETASGLTSLKVSLVGQDNSFSSRRLQERAPDWQPRSLERGLEESMAWYRGLLQEGP